MGGSVRDQVKASKRHVPPSQDVGGRVLFFHWVIGGRPWEQQWRGRGSGANRLSLCHTGGRLAKAQGAGAGSCTRAMGMSAASRVSNQNGGLAR